MRGCCSPRPASTRPRTEEQPVSLPAFLFATFIAALPSTADVPPSVPASADDVDERRATSASVVSHGVVVVLVPEVEDDVTRNAMARITGELAAAPFTVVAERVDPTREV